ncbi:MAG: cytochrome c maturation protein CcmE [Bacteroidia bacterium]|nr:cytochrome c maturation protein CcmE [Bacteroidia bacterium]HQV01522.1 cytochrome c maturation protein CcmE [Bacteroidia bacterium]
MKRSYIIALIVIALSVGAIMLSIADSSTYATFETAAENPARTYHVIGKVNFDKPFEYNPQQDANLFCFYMTDSIGAEKKVVYHNAKPQDFEKSEQIVVVGKMQGVDFTAEQVLMKCPSKYTEENKTM